MYAIRSYYVIDGARMNDVRAADRGVSMVFQSYALYPHMSVRDNIGYGMKVRGVPRAEAQSAVENAARILNLTDYP